MFIRLNVFIGQTDIARHKWQFFCECMYYVYQYAFSIYLTIYRYIERKMYVGKLNILTVKHLKYANFHKVHFIL